jgi:hypothetical protein
MVSFSTISVGKKKKKKEGGYTNAPVSQKTSRIRSLPGRSKDFPKLVSLDPKP